MVLCQSKATLPIFKNISHFRWVRVFSNQIPLFLFTAEISAQSWSQESHHSSIYIPDQSKFRMTQFYKMPIIYTGLLLPRLSQVILEKSYINLLRLMKMRFLFLKVQAERLKLTTSPLDSQYFFGYQILETHSYANARHSKANSGLAR